MPTKKKTDVAVATAREDIMPHRQSPSPMRHGDEKRGSTSDRLDNFAKNVRPDDGNKPKIDRRRERLTTADIAVPRKQLNFECCPIWLTWSGHSDGLCRDRLGDLERLYWHE